MFKTRTYQGFKATVRNGHPWSLDYDTTLGDRNAFEFDGVLYVDQIYGDKRKVDRKTGMISTITIGDGKGKDDPMQRTLQAVQSLYTVFGALAGEGTLFG